MKTIYAVLFALVLGVGCGKKATPDEAANELFVEAVELVSEAQSKESTDIPAAIKSYEQALVKVRKIVNEYKKSDLAVKLVSGETLFTGKSMKEIEEKVSELTRRAEAKRQAEAAKRQAEEEMRQAEEEMRQAEEEMRRAEAAEAKGRKLTAEEEKIVGTYEVKIGEDTGKLVLLENGKAKGFSNGDQVVTDKWKVIRKEVHVIGGSYTVFYRIEKSGDLTRIAQITRGMKRTAVPKDKQPTFKRIN